MPAYGFAFAVGVGCKVYFARALCLLGETGYNVLFAGRFFVLRLEIIGNFYAEGAFGKVAYVPARGIHFELAL